MNCKLEGEECNFLNRRKKSVIKVSFKEESLYIFFIH